MARQNQDHVGIATHTVHGGEAPWPATPPTGPSEEANGREKLSPGQRQGLGQPGPPAKAEGLLLDTWETIANRTCGIVFQLGRTTPQKHEQAIKRNWSRACLGFQQSWKPQLAAPGTLPPFPSRGRLLL
jgi:hypothetical protein